MTTPHDAVAIQAEGTCELTSLSGGRCARSSRYEVHHILYRSRGGKDDPDNLVPLCSTHHAGIHLTEKPFLRGPFQDEKRGCRYYTEDIGEDTVEKQRWYFFRDLRPELEEREQRIHAALMQARDQIDGTRYGAAVLCAEIAAAGLYSLRGYDSAMDYVCAELGESPSSARHALNVGEFLRVNPHLLSEIQTRGLHWATLRDSLGSLKRLPGNKVEAVVSEMIEAQQMDVPGASIVESVREAAGVPPRNEFEVSCGFELLGGRVAIQVTAPTPEAAVSNFERVVGLCGPLRDILRAVDQKVRKVKAIS